MIASSITSSLEIGISDGSDGSVHPAGKRACPSGFTGETDGGTSL